MAVANASQILLLLRHHGGEILSRLKVARAELSMPTDGRGARIQVSVPPDEPVNLPTQIRMKLDGDDVVVPLEIVRDFQEFHAY